MCIRMNAVLDTIPEGELKPALIGVLRASATDMEQQAKEMKEMRDRMNIIEKKVDKLESKIDAINTRLDNCSKNDEETKAQMVIILNAVNNINEKLAERKNHFINLFSLRNVLIAVGIIAFAGIGLYNLIDKSDKIATIVSAVK